jgi:hypothetical protein
VLTDVESGFHFFLTWSVAMAKEPARYSDQETQRRFEKAVKAALHTPPKPRKGITWKRRKHQLRTKSKNHKSG